MQLLSCPAWQGADAEAACAGLRRESAPSGIAHQSRFRLRHPRWLWPAAKPRPRLPCRYSACDRPWRSQRWIGLGRRQTRSSRLADVALSNIRRSQREIFHVDQLPSSKHEASRFASGLSVPVCHGCSRYVSVTSRGVSVQGICFLRLRRRPGTRHAPVRVPSDWVPRAPAARASLSQPVLPLSVSRLPARRSQPLSRVTVYEYYWRCYIQPTMTSKRYVCGHTNCLSLSGVSRSMHGMHRRSLLSPHFSHRRNGAHVTLSVSMRAAGGCARRSSD